MIRAALIAVALALTSCGDGFPTPPEDYRKTGHPEWARVIHGRVWMHSFDSWMKARDRAFDLGRPVPCTTVALFTLSEGSAAGRRDLLRSAAEEWKKRAALKDGAIAVADCAADGFFSIKAEIDPSKQYCLMSVDREFNRDMVTKFEFPELQFEGSKAPIQTVMLECAFFGLND